jgi:rod shape-determining protein MreD
VATFIAFPVLGVLLMLQMAVFSNLTILHGTADILMLAIAAWSLQEQVKNGFIWALIGGLMVSLISAVPFYPYLTGYLIIAGLSRLLQRRIWQVPILAMFLITILGTFIVQMLSLLILQFTGTALEWWESISLVMLPSALLNLLFSLPVYLLTTDLATLVYPEETEI